MSKENSTSALHSYVSDSAESTQAAASSIVGSMPTVSGASVIALSGDLGAGKTQFAKGVGRALGISRTITSPTFLIMRSYKASQGPWEYLFHLDCYRLEDPQELRVLGWDEIASNPKNLIVVEWAERVCALLPPWTVWVELEVVSPTKRAINVRP